MRILVVLCLLLAVASAQFGQFSRPGSRTIFIDDDDFDDFDDFHDDDDDSLEDLYEDLYDDDPGDRARAQAALTRLRASGNLGNLRRNNQFRGNAFRSSGFNNNRFRTNSNFNRFSNNNRFNTNTNRFNTNTNRFNTNTNRFNTNTNRFNTNTNRFNTNNRFQSNRNPVGAFVSNRNSGLGFRGANTFQALSSNNLGTGVSGTNSLVPNVSNKFGNPSVNSVTQRPAFGKNTFTPSSATSTGGSSRRLSSAPSFEWPPNANGYYFRMSSFGAEPVTYFIRYDDDD
ncbi:uncharacterized protein LOC143029463 [Oratosquilla oratoria]|uniref:uncharacterized protein LOC143029463 n=1 Tax=Oratosquilla oratoria TaxID=337810 RepID=UPI003F7653F7